MRRLLVSLLLVPVLVVGACGDDDDGGDAADDVTTTTAAGVRLQATLAGGAAEVPDGGDPDGAGMAGVQVTSTQVCFGIEVDALTLPATLAHIHKGKAGEAGPVVVTFTPPNAEGKSTGCVAVADAALTQDLVANPADYYVNVHTSDFPKGAVRGQLATG